MPGQELFGYEDEEGQPRDIGSQDVNNYLREISCQDFTAKDFRTWAGTVLAGMLGMGQSRALNLAVGAIALVEARPRRAQLVAVGQDLDPAHGHVAHDVTAAGR